MSDALGAWRGTSQTLYDIVGAGALDRFRATIQSATPPGAVPQGFHWCLCLPDTSTDALGPDGHPPKGGFLPPVTLPRRMWASSEVEFRAPLGVSARVERVSSVSRITEKSGATGPLVFVDVEHTTRADGIEAIVERQTIVYRTSGTERMPLPPSCALDLAQWTWRRSITPDPVLLFRYSAMTFNSHRIHYDLPYTIAEEHYPALVVHGPLVATLLLDLCARELGADAISRFTFRMLSPAFAGQDLHLVGEPGDKIELRALGADGRTVVSATASR